MLIFTKLINIKAVVIKENSNEMNFGLLKIFRSMFLDHLESIEKNKNIEANMTIGINIAL
tara:strand:- start:103 stop:282 length:180 start_codon:yes stop_codon:yes gene_type:complete